MFRRFSMLFVLILTLTGLPVGVASAQDMPSLDLPPGIAAQAQPLLEAMMEQMQQSGMSHNQMQMMMVDMQAMADQLPPGVFLKILELMLQLDMADMISLHQQIHQDGLLEQPPGQILKAVKRFAG
ncbi:MAG: hypothetical protein ACE5H9_22170 [Anaerolineae bacterium]